MTFDLDEAINMLERTPKVLRTMLEGLPNEWIVSNEGGETWSPYDVVGHLIYGERTPWIERIRRILDYGESKPFDPFDRFAQFNESKGKSLNDLLSEYEKLRTANLATLREMHLEQAGFDRTGVHPSFGVVTLRQLLSTYVTHDLTHIVQIARTMAMQYKDEIGPWSNNISFMRTNK